MKASFSNLHRQRHTDIARFGRSGFTLVELLVVITIIGIIAGLALPAILGAVQSSQDTSRKLEVAAIANGVEKYYQTYGDYPPDGSNLGVLNRHMGKLFPRMSATDKALLHDLTHPGGGSTFSAVAMDRAEALVFFLGGFSEDLSRPLTGPGGPLEFKNYLGDDDVNNLANYQYNATRNSPSFEFDTGRLDMAEVSGRYVSNDESRYEYSGTALSSRGGNDLLPTFLTSGGETPIVYFDSRTYGDVGGTYNGYICGGNFGSIRPYKTQSGSQEPSGSSYGSTADADAAVKYQSENTFQIIHPGADGVFGAAINDPSNPSLPVHFIAETGDAVSPRSAATSKDGLLVTSLTRFRDVDSDSAVSANGHLDNLTNSSKSTMENELP